MADDETKKDAKDATDSPYKREERPPASELVQRLIAEHGTADAALHAVAKEQWNYRERTRVAEKNLSRLEAKIQRGRLLNEDEAKAFDSYVALGLKPDAVKSLQAEHQDLKAKDAKRAKRDAIAEAAKHAESDTPWKPTVLADLAEAKGFDVVLKEVKDGEAVKKIAYAVKGEGATKVEKPLAEFEEIADYHAALRESQADSSTQGSRGADGSARGVPYPAQAARGSSSGGKPDVAGQYIQATYVPPSKRKAS